MICGIFFTNMSVVQNQVFKWEENLFKSNHIVEQLTSLITNFLIIIGILLLIIYTVYIGFNIRDMDSVHYLSILLKEINHLLLKARK
jgi:hypothetical protein